MLDDLAAARWVQAYDAAWLGQDWESLASRLAPNVEFVVPSLAGMLMGSPAVLASLRDAMSRMVIHEYNATDLTGYDHGPVGIIMYRWQLDCTANHQRVKSTGRDVLVLRAVGDRWLLVWRGQFRG